MLGLKVFSRYINSTTVRHHHKSFGDGLHLRNLERQLPPIVLVGTSAHKPWIFLDSFVRDVAHAPPDCFVAFKWTVPTMWLGSNSSVYKHLEFIKDLHVENGLRQTIEGYARICPSSVLGNKILSILSRVQPSCMSL
jgi:hypothetical protein